MITAKEATDLYEKSDRNVIDFLEKIDSRVQNAAREGRRSVNIYIDSCEAAHGIKLSNQEQLYTRVIDRLNKLGYKTTPGFIPRDRALEDAEGNGPIHYYYGITINW